MEILILLKALFVSPILRGKEGNGRERLPTSPPLVSEFLKLGGRGLGYF